MTAPSSGTPRADQRGSAAESGRLSYEQAREALADVVRALEAGGTTLEESLSLWQRGEALAQVCEEWLDGARARLDTALHARKRDADGDNAEGKDEAVTGEVEPQD